MTAVPLRRLSYRHARTRLRPVFRRAAQLAKPVRPAAANLAAMPLHVAGLACADFAAFHLPDPHFWGWLLTGVSLIWLEHVIADES
jgi:hypothetical protein